LNALRIGETCRSLQETDDSVTDIAFRVGFNNLSNFNRRFRKLKGMSPREFRAKCVDLRQGRQNQPMPRQHVYA
jgi:AraC-like DNA-binding protein